MIALGFPQIYRQAENILDHLDSYIGHYGKKMMIVSDEFVFSRYGEKLLTSLNSSHIHADFVPFCGQTSPEEIQRLTAICKEGTYDVVIGFGGGKAIDAAKGVKKALNIPVVIIPTIAASDAATSKLAITYTPEGKFLGPLVLNTNPEVVIVDTRIIVDAPVRFIIAGIGDALATHYEALQCQASGVMNFWDTRPTQAAMAISERCHDIIWAEAESALEAISRGVIDDSVEKVVEANVLLSGLGFEGCGVAAAHAISQGFTLIPELERNLHGEEVAVALLSQLVIEGRSDEFILSVIDFYRRIGLPVSLKALGYSKQTNEGLMTISTFACRPKSRIFNMAVEVNPDVVFNAMKKVEMLTEKSR